MTTYNYLEAPIPEKTKSYTPVAHGELIEFVEGRLDAAGFTRTSLVVDQTKDGNIITANMGLAHKENSEFHQEFSIINSYNKAKPVTFASGARVFVCSNGMIISEEVITVRRHTTNVWNELGDKADTAIQQLNHNWERTVREANAMKSLEIPFTSAAELLGRIYVEERILNPTEMNIAVRELRNPTFEDFKAPNLWSLYNTCTFALKDAHPYYKNSKLKHLHDFCVQLAPESLVNA